MKKNLIYGAIGFVASPILLSSIAWLTADKVMIIEDESRYDFRESVDRIETRATELGWKVPNIHRLDKSLAKHGHKVKEVAVIELCHPDYASAILKEDKARIVSSLMPCRIAVYKTSSEKVIISRMNTGLMSKIFGGIVTKIMAVASKDTEKILKSVL